MKLTDFIEMKPITRGWSKEKKFYVSKEDGERFLLRISPLETYEKKKVFFDKISQVAKLDIPMSKPVELEYASKEFIILKHGLMEKTQKM